MNNILVENNIETIQDLAQYFLNFLERKERQDESVFYCLADDRPEELRDILYEVHDGMMPDDYKYEFTKDALMHISNAPQRYDYGELYDYGYELEPNCYTHNLTEWLHSHNTRVYYLTEVLGESEVKDGFQLLTLAQSKEIQEVYNTVLESLNELIEKYKGE